MKYKSLLLSIAVITTLFFLSCSSPLVYTSLWQDKPVAIDGKATEWKIPLDYYDDKTKLNFSISNDTKNIYFCVRATEDETQKGIIRNGLRIWIDTTGGKKDQAGLQFPIIQSHEKEEGSSTKSSESSESAGASAAHSLKYKYAGLPKQIKLSGFTGVPGGLAEVPNIYGINACLNWDTNNIMIYEACIPLSTFYKAALSPSDSSKVFGLSFTVMVTSKYGGGGGHGGGGGGGMGGGGMHGGGGGGRHSGNSDESGGSSGLEALTAHIKIKLAMPQH